MSERAAIAGDWYDGWLPPNVAIGEGAELDTTFGLTRFSSARQPAMELGRGSGSYGSTFVTGPQGHIAIGEFTCLNSATLICDASISIGAHCLVSWGVMISDVDLASRMPEAMYRQALERAASDPDRRLPPLAPPRPVVIEDAVWIGFGSVILPGVTIGRGSIVGCKTVVDRDVPPGVVVAGNPFRIVRRLDPADDRSAADSIPGRRFSPTRTT